MGSISINTYELANMVCSISGIISELLAENEELHSRIASLRACTGTKKNPHNHNGEIAACQSLIETNNNRINRLEELKTAIITTNESVANAERILCQMLLNAQMQGGLGTSNIDSLSSRTTTTVKSDIADIKKLIAKYDKQGSYIASNEATKKLNQLNDELKKCLNNDITALKNRIDDYQKSGQYSAADAASKSLNSYTAEIDMLNKTSKDHEAAMVQIQKNKEIAAKACNAKDKSFLDEIKEDVSEFIDNNKLAFNEIKTSFSENGFWDTMKDISTGCAFSKYENISTSFATMQDTINSALNSIFHSTLSTTNTQQVRTDLSRQEQNIDDKNNAYYSAKALSSTADTIGGIITAVGGGVIATAGVTGDVAGIAASATGIGAIAGVPTIAVSTAAVAVGAVTVGAGASMTVNSYQNFNNNVSKIEGTGTSDSIPELKNTDNFKDGALEHILEGEVNKSGDAVGYHSEAIPDSKGEIIPGTKSTPDENGIYKAKVKVDGVPKTSNGGKSTFFPEDWSAQDVVDGINEAYDSKKLVKGTKYKGETVDGIKVEMYIDNKTNEIITAYPVPEN